MSPASRKRLLIVVDDWEALELYENRFASRFEVFGAPFGSEGIRVASEAAPDRIFLDLTSEDMHASEACQKLRTRPETRFIPITVVLNEGEAPLEVPGFFPHPADQVIFRPFEFDRLMEQLASGS